MSVRYFDQETPPLRARDNDRWRDSGTGRGYRWRDGRGWVRFVDQRAKNKWKPTEDAILRSWFGVEGVDGVAARLHKRKVGAIQSRAGKLRLLGPLGARGTRTVIMGEDLAEAVRLRTEEGWGFARIGARFGVSEGGATNSVMIEISRRGGGTPAERDRNGVLTGKGLEQLREALRKGWKGKDIMARLAVSASTISNERRRYNADLKARGKRPLPPPGAGTNYSGARISRERKHRAEAIYLAGHGTPKVTRETGISNTHALRIRAKLIRRLARKGEILAGCDRKGVRRRHVDSARLIAPRMIDQVRQLLLDGVSHIRAANLVGIGDCSAYRIRLGLIAELAEQGRSLPPTIKVGKGMAKATRWLPPGARWIFFYRKLARDLGQGEARRLIEDGIATLGALPAAISRAIELERRSRPATFEEQLAKVRGGADIARRLIVPGRVLPDITLGGIGSAAL